MLPLSQTQNHSSVKDISNLPNSLQNLIKFLSQTQSLTPELVKQFVSKAQVEEEDLLPWATCNHPVTDSYGRKLVYDGGYFEIMVMSWVPGDFSAIHDHGYAQWGAVKSFGKAQHIVYKLENDILQTQNQMWFQPNQILKVNHDLIHQMGNPTDSSFLSLHVYGCPNRDGEVTGDARVFDLFENCIQLTNGGVFFCLPEEEISSKKYNLQGDLSTTLRHNEQMLARVNSILNNPHYSSVKWELKAKLIKAKIMEIKLLIDKKN